MKIGIMGAMPEEIDIVREQMTNIVEIEHASRTYYLGKINSYDIVLVFSRWGMVAASATVTTLIEKFGINELIFTGVAGAASPDLNIGDIVISDQLFNHRMDPRPLFPIHETPLTGITHFKANKRLIEKAAQASTNLLAKHEQNIPKATLDKFGISAPKYVTGTIASGDLFVSDINQTKAILAERPETLAVEMEGAAIAQICHEHQIPFVVIRTISDRADHQAHIDFPCFVDQVAKYYTNQIIQHMLA